MRRYYGQRDINQRLKMKVRQSLCAYAAVDHRRQTEAAKKVFFNFIDCAAQKHDLLKASHHFRDQIAKLSFKFGYQIDQNRGKLNFMKLAFDKEADAMVGRLLKQNKNNNKLLTDQITALSTINKTLRDSLLKRYITRCKITHSLAFFQWRAKHVPRADRDELVEVFEEKVQKTIQFIEEATKKRKHKVITEQKRAAQQA